MRQISVQDKSKLVGQTNWDPTKRTQFEAKMISNFNFRRLWKLDGCDGSGGRASNTDTEGPEFEYHWDWGRFFAKFDDIVNWKKSVMPKIKLSAARSRSRDSNHCSIPTPHDCFIVSQEIAGKDCQCRLGQKKNVIAQSTVKRILRLQRLQSMAHSLMTRLSCQPAFRTL